ncbi:hypothetical protein XELAEV_18013712mg [Xenopus laevis]|uniref:Uncharacterized protein n=1 Tax=Xenopus laevis TaxID=8355 RepID=A0A974HZP6_XENLA|nr:hypothetical protein XELAEV_18013712mg [Xenopus laevis]
MTAEERALLTIAWREYSEERQKWEQTLYNDLYSSSLETAFTTSNILHLTANTHPFHFEFQNFGPRLIQFFFFMQGSISFVVCALFSVSLF